MFETFHGDDQNSVHHSTTLSTAPELELARLFRLLVIRGFKEHYLKIGTISRTLTNESIGGAGLLFMFPNIHRRLQTECLIEGT